MTLEAVSFVIGGILIVTAIVGGGFEIKEIKMPRVGAVPRFFSLVVGAFFVLIGIGVWEVDRQALLNQQVPVNTFAPTNGAAPQESAPPESAAPGRQVAVEPEPAAPAEPEWQFPGIHGRFQLSWAIGEVPISAYMEVQGTNGVVRISYTDPETGMPEEVDQDLVLQQSGNKTYYQGMNPRVASTQQPYPEYNPDMFRLVEVQTNSWAVTETCDVNVCSPVYAEVIPE